MNRRFPTWAGLILPAGLFSAALLGCVGVLFLFSLFSFVNGSTETTSVSLGSWTAALTDPFFWEVLGRTIEVAIVVTIATIVISYVTALALWHVRSMLALAIASVILASPLIISLVVRSYGWLLILGDHGVVNDVLRVLGLETSPIRIIYDYPGVIVALIHGAEPLAVFPIWAALRQVPTEQLEAAADLGASPLTTWRRIVFPLSLTGVIAAAQLVFLVNMAAYVTPMLLGGGRVLLTAQLIYANETNLNWPLGSIQAIVLVSISLLLLLASNMLTSRVLPRQTAH